MKHMSNSKFGSSLKTALFVCGTFFLLTSQAKAQDFGSVTFLFTRCEEINSFGLSAPVETQGSVERVLCHEFTDKMHPNNKGVALNFALDNQSGKLVANGVEAFNLEPIFIPDASGVLHYQEQSIPFGFKTVTLSVSLRTITIEKVLSSLDNSSIRRIVISADPLPKTWEEVKEQKPRNPNNPQTLRNRN